MVSARGRGYDGVVSVGTRLVLARSALALMVALAACGDDSAPPMDGGAGDGARDAPAVDDGAPEAPLSPMPTSLPELGPCPDGFRDVPAEADGASGIARCEPWPESGRATCGPGQAHFVGEPGCVALALCAAGDFADGIDDGATIFVDPSAAPAGDGSRAAPLLLIAEALAVDDGRTVIALARGTYEERVVVSAGVRSFVGACAEDTVLSPAGESDDEAAIEVTAGAEVTLSGLTVDARRPGVRASGTGTRVTLGGVAITGARRAAIDLADGALLDATALAVRDTAADATGTDGHALLAEGVGTVATIERAVLVRNHTVAVSGTSGASISLRRVAVLETESEPASRTLGRGVYVIGATADLDACVLEGNRDMVLRADGPDGHLTVTSSLVRGTRPTEIDDSFGFAVAGAQGATVSLSKSVFADSTALGLAFQHTGTSATFADVVLERVAVNGATNVIGYGLDIKDGVTVTADRFAILDATVFAVRAEGATSRTTLRDLYVARPAPNGERAGAAVGALAGAVVTIERARLEACTGMALGAGLSAPTAMSTIHADDVVVDDIRPLVAMVSPELLGTLGVAAFADQGELVLRRWRVRGGYVMQVGASNESRVTLEDVTLVEGGLNTDGLVGAAGIVAVSGAQFDLTRVIIEDGVTGGLWASGGTVFGHDVRVSRILGADCSSGGCDVPGGFAALVDEGGSISLDRFALEGSELAGISIGPDGTADLTNGVVAANAIGANVQNTAFDLERIQERVRYIDNDLTLDTTALPLPTPPSGAGLGAP